MLQDNYYLRRFSTVAVMNFATVSIQDIFAQSAFACCQDLAAVLRQQG
jgi:hypothetical protein